MEKEVLKKLLLELLDDEDILEVLKEKLLPNVNEIDLRVKQLDERAVLPCYGTSGAAAFDLRCLLDEKELVLKPGDVKKLHTGLAMSIPKGYVGIIAARSGLGCKKGLIPSNAIGIIDSDYRGEIIVALYNHSDDKQVIEDRERVAQMLIMPYVLAKMIFVDDLDATDRGDGGFGHSGRH